MKSKNIAMLLLMICASAFAVESGWIYVSMAGSGEIIDYIDPQDWGEDAAHILRGNCGAFRYFPVSVEEKGTYQSIIADTTTSKLMDFGKLEAVLGDNKFTEEFYSKEGAAVILPKFVDYTAKIKNEKDVNNPAVLDVKSISSGSATVGSGGDYATWAAAFTDIANLTGNLTFTQISDVTETAESLIREDLGGYAFVCTSNSQHGGNPKAGWLITQNSDDYTFRLQGVGAGSMSLDGVHILSAVAQTGSKSVVFANNNDSSTVNINDNLIDCNGGTGHRGIDVRDANVTHQIYNNVVWEAENEGILIVVSNAANLIENNIFYGCNEGLQFTSDALGVSRNNICVSTTTDFVDISAATGYNNASYDATAANANWGTGTGNIENITPANEFVSTDDTSPYFLKLKDGSLDGAGATPGIAGNTTGIRGNAMASPPSIGADECWVATYDTTYRDSVFCSGGLFQADSMQADSLNWIDTVSTVTYREIGVCDRGIIGGIGGGIGGGILPWLKD